MARESLSRSQARRVALAAQGFAAPRLDRPATLRDVTATVHRLGQFQIDSVNVVTRAHYTPLYSRLGPYDTTLLERAAQEAPRRLFEYWGHAASLIDVRLQPLLRFRMHTAAQSAWSHIERIAREQPALVDWVRGEVAERGPISARQIEHDEVRSKDGWGWNWSSVKTVLEWLFYAGEVTSARRNVQFERVYDLPERVIPSAILRLPDPTPQESARGLVRQAARSLGVATEPCLRDYFRTGPAITRAAVAELVEAGELRPVTVEGWADRPTYLWHEVRVPRSIDARALVSPFDSIVFERHRLERLFGFFYRIEIYVPAEKRVHGYYVYPFLLGERFVARVDLKADRTGGVLRVNGAWLEVDSPYAAGQVAEQLGDELVTFAGWLGLSGVAVMPHGDLAAALAAAVTSR